MLSDGDLRDILNRTDITSKDKLLVLLYSTPETPTTGANIRNIAVSLGLHEAENWNMSYLLNSMKGLTVKVKNGWTLSAKGRDYVSNSEFLLSNTLKKTVIPELRQHLALIKDVNTVSFIEEAIICLENHLYRAAVVLSWAGAISLLHDCVVKQHLTDFNTVASQRNSRWREARTTDDLGKMKEHDFLDILETLSIIGKNVKQELQNNCLKLRNACSHPNSLNISQHRVAAHLEILILNVFSKFV